MNDSNVFSEHGIRLIKENFSDTNNIKIIYSREILSHDGYDKYGPLSNIWDLYLCVQDLTAGIYTYYHYNTENWYTEKKGELIYELCKDYISSNYLVTPYSQGNFFGDTHTYMCTVIRVVNNINGFLESEWNKLTKNDLYHVNIYLDGVKLDPFKVVELSDSL
jgi:hypothetical protein